MKNDFSNMRLEYKACPVSETRYAGKLYIEVKNGQNIRCCLGMKVGDPDWPMLFAECYECPRYIKNVQEA